MSGRVIGCASGRVRSAGRAGLGTHLAALPLGPLPRLTAARGRAARTLAHTAHEPTRPLLPMSLTTTQLDEVRARFLSFLKESGQRRTPERLAILDALYATSDHVDADTLYARMLEGRHPGQPGHRLQHARRPDRVRPRRQAPVRPAAGQVRAGLRLLAARPPHLRGLRRDPGVLRPAPARDPGDRRRDLRVRGRPPRAHRLRPLPPRGVPPIRRSACCVLRVLLLRAGIRNTQHATARP